LKKVFGSNSEMLDEYALVPDIFDRAAYSNPDFIEVLLPHLREPLLQQALVRDLCDGGWSKFCLQNSGSLHILCKEFLKKLTAGNRIRRYPRSGVAVPTCASDWCTEGISASGSDPLTGIIASHATKQGFSDVIVASIEKITSTPWWQARSSSVNVDRKIADYLKVLNRVLLQANSLMFIDPNLDPSSYNYRQFHKLLEPLGRRTIKPRIEIHRSLCKGDGAGRTFPTETAWKEAFADFGATLRLWGLASEVFFWDDFHDRYLIADIIGITVPAGFDVTGKADDRSTWGRIGRDSKDEIQRLFDPAARPDKLKWRFMVGKI
jgi:hypothetical protein